MRINRSGRKLSRPARNVNLVFNAMRNLGEENGSTVGNIIEYISDTVEYPASKREVLAALKRGVEFGILDRKRRRYFLPGEKRRINLLGSNRGDSETGKSDISDTSTSIGDARATGKSRVFERRHRFKSRNTDKTKRESVVGKSKDSSRRKRKSRKKSTGRKSKSVKRTRFARSLKSYDLSDYYTNPSYRASGVSSIDSMEYWEGEESGFNRPSYIN